MQAYSDNQADVNGEWVSSATLHKLSGDKEGTGKEWKRNGEGGREGGRAGGLLDEPNLPPPCPSSASPPRSLAPSPPFL